MSLLYSSLKILRFPEKIDSLPLNAPLSGPLHLRIKPTNICNHRCYYCCFRTKEAGPMGRDMHPGDSIPIETLNGVFDDFAHMGGKAVTFSGGGEPFVYPHLLEAAEKLAHLGVKFATLTNGALLKGDVSRFFARNASWVRVSMDGWDDESYRQYRDAGEGEYSKIIRNMAAFLEQAQECALSVAYNIDARNYSHIPGVLRDLKSIGVRSVQLTACIVNEDAQRQFTYHSPFFEQTKRLIAEARAGLENEAFEIKDNYVNVLKQYVNDFPWCPYQQILSVIGADSCVYSCQHKAYNHACGYLGSLREERFYDFWMRDKKRFFRIAPCRDCNHFCVAHDKNALIFNFLDIDKKHLEFV